MQRSNVNPSTGPYPWVNLELEPARVSWNERDVLLFANSIGCSVDGHFRFLYERHPEFSAFPTYPTVLTFKHSHTSIVDFRQHFDTYINAALPGVPRFDSTRVVDGGRAIRILRKLPVTSEGKTFEVRTRVLNVWDKGKGKGSTVDLSHHLWEVASKESDKDLEYFVMEETAYYIGQGGWGGPRGPPSSKSRMQLLVRYKKADVTIKHRIPINAHLLYRLNGDYNPLHASDISAKAAGFDSVIMHGLYGWNVTCRVLLETFGYSDPSNLRRFAARFTAPVCPGDLLIIEAWVVEQDLALEWSKINFRVTKYGNEKSTEESGGQVCLDDGIASIRVTKKLLHGKAGSQQSKF